LLVVEQTLISIELLCKPRCPMSVESTITRPTSIDEVQSVVSKWLQATPSHTPSEIRFSRLKTTNCLEVSTQLNKGLTVEQDDDNLSWSVPRRKLTLELCDFSVRTSYKNDVVIIVVRAREEAPLKSLSRALNTVATTKHPIYFARALTALCEIADDLPSQGIDDLSTASTDKELLLNSLWVAPVINSLTGADPLAKAKLRGIDTKKRLLDKCGGTLSATDVAELLHLSRQAIEKRRRSNQLIGLTQGRRGYVYPSFQFEDGNTLTGFGEVMKVLSGHDPWMQVIFFVNENDRLQGKSPVDALRSGDLKAVLLAATAFGEQGAA
jgi:hypothetical protein